MVKMTYRMPIELKGDRTIIAGILGEEGGGTQSESESSLFRFFFLQGEVGAFLR